MRKREIAAIIIAMAVVAVLLGSLVSSRTTSSPTAAASIVRKFEEAVVRNGGSPVAAAGGGGSAKAAEKKIALPADVVKDELPEHLRGTAFVTLATGDESARQAVALVQSLREVGTQIPDLVVLLSRGGMGSADCQDPAWKRANNRENIGCGSADTIAPEIISQQYIDTLTRLGAKMLVIDPIPDTPYTIIPGGRAIFWGMAFNKLHIFGMTQYRKIMWMDSDTLVLKNIDHLLREPMFTAAFTYDCCNGNSPPKPSGGLWIVEPSDSVKNELINLISNPVPGTKDKPWHWGDMMVVRYLFGKPPEYDAVQPYWPRVEDGRMGYVPGLKYLPEHAKKTPDEIKEYVKGRVAAPYSEHEGLMPEFAGETKPIWRLLDTRYDQCVGHCECIPERDMPKTYMSVHFSCIHHVAKPSKYESEHELINAIYSYALSCTRYYFLTWYQKFSAAHGRYPAPHWDGPPVPVFNATHDEIVRANRLAAGV